MSLALLVAFSAASAQDLPQTCYLFTSFRGNGEDGLHLAYSIDGLKWTSLKQDKSFLAPRVGSEKLMRDPCITVGPDGVFHMVWTTGWRGSDIGYAHSRDLIHWSPQRAIPVMEHEPTAINCWAPEIIYDPSHKDFLIYWSTTIPGRFAGDAEGDGGYNHRIYFTRTSDFDTFEPTKLFFDPGHSVIDATLVADGDRVVMIYKDERKNPLKKHLRVGFGKTFTGPFADFTEPFTPVYSEGPTVLKVGQDFICYYDLYHQNRYGAMRTRDFRKWDDLTDQLQIAPGTRHGTAFPVRREILQKLLEVEPNASSQPAGIK